MSASTSLGVGYAFKNVAPLSNIVQGFTDRLSTIEVLNTEVDCLWYNIPKGPESTSTPANLLGSYIPPKITKKAIISRINDFKDRWWDPIFTNRPQTSTYGMGESPLD